MKSFLRTLLMTTALSASLAGIAAAQDETAPDATAPDVVTTEEASPEMTAPPISVEMDAPYFVMWVEGAVRAEPSGGAARLTTLPFGTKVTVTGEVAGTDWVRVELEDGTVGYMWGELLNPMTVALPSTGGTAPGTTTAAGSGDGDGDTIDTATDIGALTPEGFSTSGTLSSTDLDDYFSFTVDGWTEVTADLTGIAADVDLILVDATSTEMGSSMNTDVEAEHLVATVGPGTYYLQVTNYAAADTPYDLVVSGAPGAEPPPDGGGNTLDAPTVLGAVDDTSPLTVSDWVGAQDYEDYYSFEITGTKKVTIRLDGMSDDADLSLFRASDGTYLAGSANYESEPDEITATLEAGTYVFSVANAGNQTDFTVTVSTEPGQPIPADTAGNFAEEATVIGDPTAGTLHEEGWVGIVDPDDYFSITLARPAEVAITLTPKDGNADLDLISGDGMNYIGSSANSDLNTDRIIQSLQAGTYLVHVFTYNGETSYTLDIGAK